jgi:uncharacterized protein YndB with AHSA1/START domain
MEMRKLRQETVDFKIQIKAPIEQVFDHIATAEGLDKWFTSDTSMDSRPGGAIVFRWKNWGIDNYTGEFPGEVVEVKRPSRFTFQWMADSGGYFTTAEFDFESFGDSTLVRIRESGYEDSTEGMQDLLNRVSGWAHVLTLLKFYLEYGIRT